MGRLLAICEGFAPSPQYFFSMMVWLPIGGRGWLAIGDNDVFSILSGSWDVAQRTRPLFMCYEEMFNQQNGGKSSKIAKTKHATAGNEGGSRANT